MSSDKAKLNNLFQQCRIGKMKLKNRIIMPPMSTGYASTDGSVTEQLKDYYEERARGGVGLIIVESASVDSANEKVTARQLVVDDDRFIPGLRSLAQAIQKHGARVALSVNHAGGVSKSSITHRQPLAPSVIPVQAAEPPRELSVGDIEDIIVHFVQAARRAKNAGFDGVEIHAAHRYLLSSFLSSAWNKRQDGFGGSLQNRAGILLEIIRRTRAMAGQIYPIWCRINGMEYGLEGGTTLNEATGVARMVEGAGCDAVHVSAYGYGAYASVNRGHMGYPRGNLVHLAQAIKKAVTVPVIAVGRIDLLLGEEVIREQKADLVAIGRPLIADPLLVAKTTEGRPEDVIPCIACNNCIDGLFRDISLRCSVNASVGKERDYILRATKHRKKVLVVGGGPAGMEAARIAALRGHEVVLYERQARLGGQLLLAMKPPHKDEIQPYVKYLTNQIEKLGVKIRAGKEADTPTIDRTKPDTVILAPGSDPLIPEIKGVSRDNVVLAEQVLSGKEVGATIVIIGGGLVGCETAEFLAEKGNTVTIVEVAKEIAPNVGFSVRAGLLSRLTGKGVRMVAGAKSEEITDTGVIISTNEEQRQTIKADTVVLAAGVKPKTELLEAMRDKVSEIYLLGGSGQPHRILEAVAEGSRIGRAV